MKRIALLIITAFFSTPLILSACASAPPPTLYETQLALDPSYGAESGEDWVPPDYTRDWESIIGWAEIDPKIQLLWKKRNWRMTLSGEWIDDLIEDFQRRYRWDKKLKEWVAEYGNPDWPD